MAGFARTHLLMALGLSVLVTASTACGFGGTGATVAKPATTGPAAPGQQASQANASKPAQASAGTSAKPYSPVDPCSLTTAAEVEGVVGKLRSGPTPEKYPDGTVFQCKFVTEKGDLVTIDVVNGANWEIHKGMVAGDKDTKMVSGVGEGAFLKKLGSQYILEIQKNPYDLEIAVTLDSNESLEATKAIAEKALPRL